MYIFYSWTFALAAARTCLVVQNSCVAACAAGLAAYLGLFRVGDSAASYWSVVAFSVALSAAAALASNGTVIVLQRDWIVVIAGEDKDMLAGTYGKHRSSNSDRTKKAMIQ